MCRPPVPTRVTVRLHHDDPYALEFDARIVARLTHEGRPALVLDRTAFYAESGGQPWDLGTLGGVAVTAVIDDGARVLHVLERPLGAGVGVHGVVDRARRRDHMQQHHGQHLLSRAFVERHGVETVGFHLGSQVTTIDLARAVAPDEVRDAVRRANEVVAEGRPVTVRTLTRAEAGRLGCRVPAEAGEAVRVVDAGGFDVQPCSGTHPRTTAEVGLVLALQAERYKGGTRLHFVCGERAQGAVATRQDALDRLGAILRAPLLELPAAAERALEELARARKREKELIDRLLRFEARELLAQAAPGTTGVRVVVVAFDARPAAELRALALELTRAGRCVALLGARGEAAQLVFARSKGLEADVAGALQAALPIVGGRGGGQGDVVQGGGPQVERVDDALAAATARLRT